MLLKYTPEGADERTWTFDPSKLLSSEAEAIEKVTGLTYGEFGTALIKGSAGAKRALLWVMLKREEPSLKHSQLDVPVGAVVIDYERHEMQAIRDGLAEDTTLPEDAREEALAEFDKLLAEGDDEEAPKAPVSKLASAG